MIWLLGHYGKKRGEVFLPLCCIGIIVFSAAPNFYYSHALMRKTPSNYPDYLGIPQVREVIRGLRDSPETRVYLDYDNAWGFTYGMGACLLEGVGEVTQYSSFNPKNYKDWTIYKRLGIRPEEHWGGYPNEYSQKTISYLPRRHMLGYDNSEIYSYTLMLRPPMNRDSLTFLGVKYVLGVSSFDKENADKLGLLNIKDWGVSYPGVAGSLNSADLGSAMPRAFILYGIQDAKFFELKNEMDPVVRGNTIRIKSGGFKFDPAVIDNYYPEKVLIRAQAKESGYLVLSDLYHPFWHARVDGKEADIFPAFSVFRAVSLSPGNHRIEFYCKVPGLKETTLFSLLVIFTTSFMNFLYIRKNSIHHGSN